MAQHFLPFYQTRLCRTDLQWNAAGWTPDLLLHKHWAEEKRLITTSHSHVQPNPCEWLLALVEQNIVRLP